MAEGQVPIFVINLDSALDRCQRIAGRLEALGLSYERFPAITGSSLSEAEKVKLNPKRSWIRLSDSEIGCYLSHLAVFRLAADRELPRAIVLEDDAIFEKDFPVWTASDCPLPPGLDILKLEGFGAQNTLKVPVARHANKLIQFSYKPTGGTAAYLITLKGARKALQKLGVARGELDYDLFAYWKTGLRIYEVFPFPVRQDGSEATISHSHLRGRRPWRMRVGRYVMKSADKVGRLRFAITAVGLRALLAGRR